jgi:hypothetical protein
MTGLTNRRLSEIEPEQIRALMRRAHQERSRVAREVMGTGVRWLAGLLREAGVAARLSEAPKPYPAKAYPRTRLCG